jgi:methanethiol S-methyltransferase
MNHAGGPVPRRPPAWQGWLTIAFAGLSASMFALVMVWIAGFLANIVVMRGADGPVRSSPMHAVVVNLAWLALFAIPHSVMARPGFKRIWQRLLPAATERAVYVVVASILMAGWLWHFEPMEPVIWAVQGIGKAILRGIFALFAVVNALLIVGLGRWELVGMEQVWRFAHGSAPPVATLRRTGIHAWIRHPMLAAILGLVWTTPRMTAGHLLLAVGVTVYGLVGTIFEERDLVATFGDDYLRYRRDVPALFPRRPKART